MGVASAIGARSGARKASRKLRDIKRSASLQLKLEQEEIKPFREAARRLVGQFDTDDPAAALNQLRALSGALGQDAQAEAFRSFEEGPGVEFLRERGLRGVDRRAAAGGALGSGRRLEALTEFSQGLALQDLGRQTSLLGGVESREQNLLGTRLRLEGQEAADVSRFRTGLANIELGSAPQAIQIAREKGAATANIVGASISDAVALAGLVVGGLPGLAAGAVAQQGLSFDTADPFGGVNIGGAARPLTFDQRDPFGSVNLGFGGPGGPGG